jgi:hypothetical protein
VFSTSSITPPSSPSPPTSRTPSPVSDFETPISSPTSSPQVTAEVPCASPLKIDIPTTNIKRRTPEAAPIYEIYDPRNVTCAQSLQMLAVACEKRLDASFDQLCQVSIQEFDHHTEPFVKRRKMSCGADAIPEQHLNKMNINNLLC